MHRDYLPAGERARLEQIDAINNQLYKAHIRSSLDTQIRNLEAELTQLTYDTWPERYENERLGKPAQEPSSDLKKKTERMKLLREEISELKNNKN